MSLKNLDSIANHVDRCDSRLWCILDEKIGQSLQVGIRMSGVDYLRHVRIFAKASLATDGITIRGRTHPYSDIRSVEASFMSLNVSQYWPKLMLDVVGSKPIVILTRGLAIDSLSLQRTLLWAKAKAARP
jgi:hypothetical protein